MDSNNNRVDKAYVGNVVASFFRNSGENGAFHKATFRALWRNGDDSGTTGSFGRTECVLLAKAAWDAATRLRELDDQVRASNGSAAASPNEPAEEADAPF